MVRWQQIVGTRLPRVGRERQELCASIKRTYLTSSSNSGRPYQFPFPFDCRRWSSSGTNSSRGYAASPCWSSCRWSSGTCKGNTSVSACVFSISRHLTERTCSCSRMNDNACSRPGISSSRWTDNTSRVMSGDGSTRSSSSSCKSSTSKRLSRTSRDGGHRRCSAHAENSTRGSKFGGNMTSCVDSNRNSGRTCTDIFCGWSSRRVADPADRVAVETEVHACVAALVSSGSNASARQTTAVGDVALGCRIERHLPVLNVNMPHVCGRSCLFSCTGRSFGVFYPGSFPRISPSRTRYLNYATFSRSFSSSTWFDPAAASGELCRICSGAPGLSRVCYFRAALSSGRARVGVQQQERQHQQLLPQRNQLRNHQPKQFQRRSGCEALWPPSKELLRCANAAAHEGHADLPDTPHFRSSPPTFPPQQMNMKKVSLDMYPSSLPVASFPVAGAPRISLPLPGDGGVLRASCFSSTTSNRSSDLPAAERTESVVASKVSAELAAAQQAATASVASNAGTSSTAHQQTQRPQPPLQPQTRSAVTATSYSARRTGTAGSSASKSWSFLSVHGLCRLVFRIVSSLWGVLLRGTRTFFKYLRMILSNPMVMKKFWKKGKESAIHTWRWTVTGFSLFYANVRVSYQLLKKKILGHPLRYNEHKLLVRTTADALKLIPFSLMIVIPLGELMLPVMLRLFPNMLPSTFFEKQVDNAYLSRKLKAKQELAAFFQELVREHTKHIIEHESNDALKDKAKALREFQEKLLRKDQKDVNPFLSLKDILSFAKLFKEEFVLEKLDLQTLQVMCKLLGIEPYSLQSHVILQLRYHLNNIQREDREFMWEGVETLSHDELVEACKERAMMFHSISDEDMREQMRQWLEISSHKDIPPLLLLWCRCITLTHRPIPPPAVDLKSSSTKTAAAGKALTAATAAAPGGGSAAAGDGAGRAGAAAAQTTETTRPDDGKEPGLAAAPAVPSSPPSPATTGVTVQQQEHRVAEAASRDHLMRQLQEAGHFVATSDGEQLRQPAPAAQPAEHHAATADASGPAAEGRGTAATNQRQQEGLGEKREDEEDADDEEEKLKAATLEAMERQVELLRAEEETLRQSVLLLQEEEAQRKKMQAAEAEETLESASEHNAALAGGPAKAPAVGELSSTRDAASTADGGQQQQQMRVRSPVSDEARDTSAAATAAPAAAAPSGPSPGGDKKDDVSLNELARVRSGREMLQRRARRMELELKLLRRLADMQHHQQEEAFGALSKVLQAAHACRVKQEALQQLMQLREQQEQRQHQQERSAGNSQADEHLKQHLDAERGHHIQVQRQQKQCEAPAATGAATATAAAADFPKTVTQLEHCVEDVIRKFAEGVQQVEQLMRDAKRLQMNDNDPLFYPEDHSDMEDVCSVPASSHTHAEQSHTILSGPASSALSSSCSPSPSTAGGARTYSAVPFAPSSDHALYPQLNGQRDGGGGGERRAEEGGELVGSSSCTAVETGLKDETVTKRKGATHAHTCI